MDKNNTLISYTSVSIKLDFRRSPKSGQLAWEVSFL